MRSVGRIGLVPRCLVPYTLARSETLSVKVPKQAVQAESVGDLAQVRRTELKSLSGSSVDRGSSSALRARGLNGCVS